MKSALITALLAVVLSSQSSANLLVNGGFETGDLTGWVQQGFTNGMVTGPRSTSQGLAAMPPFEGNFMWSSIISGWSADVDIRQSVYLEPGSYTLTFHAQAETTSFPEYQEGYVNPDDYVSGHSNANVRIDLDGGSNVDVYTYAINGLTHGLYWKKLQINFTVTEAKNVTIFLKSQQGDPYPGHWVAYDDVSLVKVTPAGGAPSPMLTNGDFEDGMNGWVQTGSGSVVPGGFGIVPCSGSNNWQLVTNGVEADGRFSQELLLTPGVWTVKACVQSATNRRRFVYLDGQPSPYPISKVAIRANLSGTGDTSDYQISTGEIETGFLWKEANLTFEVDETKLVALIFDADGPTAEFAGRWLAFDNIRLFAPSDILLGDAKQAPDGTTVSLGNVVVTSNNLEIGANYIEAPDRSSGIRFDSADFLVTGDSINVRGDLATAPSGERYLTNTQVMANNGFAPVAPMFTKVGNLGELTAQNKGLSTTGLLIRCAGKITEVLADGFILTDGSATVKVVTTGTGFSAVQGAAVDVVGVVRLEGATPATASAILRPRSISDIIAQ